MKKEDAETSDMIAHVTAVMANSPVRASTVFEVLVEMFSVLCIVLSPFFTN